MKALQNKLALITGGSSGIGLALAKDLAQHGMRIAILSRRADALAKAQAEIQPLSQYDVLTLAADVSDWQQIQSVLSAFQDEHGVPDLLVNSAGVVRPGLFEELTVDLFQWMISINLMGPIHTCKVVVPGMVERGSGHIVNVSSMAGFIGTYGYTAYGASKFGLRGFSDALRSELLSRGIQVSVVFPPDTDTPQLAGEDPYKPAVTRQLAASARVQSAEMVAETIRKGIQKERHLIIPGLDTKALYLINNLPFRIGYHVLDWMVAQAEKKTGIS